MAEWMKLFRPERKVEWSDVAQTIRESVTVEDVLTTYCPGIHIRNRRCPCPIHHGQDFNFSFNDHGYTCFVCGSSGDVIDLVKAVCELATRADAMKRINLDMRLNLPLAGEAATGGMSDELKRKREEAEAKRKALWEWHERYEALWDEWAELDKIIHDSLSSVEDKAAAVEKQQIVEYKIDNLPEEPR